MLLLWDLGFCLSGHYLNLSRCESKYWEDDAPRLSVSQSFCEFRVTFPSPHISDALSLPVSPTATINAPGTGKSSQADRRSNRVDSSSSPQLVVRTRH